MTTDTEALLRSAYDLAEGDRLDGEGFIDLFAENGVFNGIGGVSVQESYRGEQLGDVVVWLRPYEPPAGVIQPTEVKLDLPTADFWCVRDGKAQEFNCHIGTTTTLRSWAYCRTSRLQSRRPCLNDKAGSGRREVCQAK